MSNLGSAIKISVETLSVTIPLGNVQARETHQKTINVAGVEIHKDCAGGGSVHDRPEEESDTTTTVCHLAPSGSPHIITVSGHLQGKETWGILGCAVSNKLVFLERCELGYPILNLITLTELETRAITLPKSPEVVVQERWFAPVEIYSQRTDWLIDTGATTTLITRSFYDSLRLTDPIQPTKMMVNVANGAPIRTS